MLKVNEVFQSVQGEGVWAGVRATFIRLQGCTVGCSWCDTKGAWSGARGDEWSEEELVRFCSATGNYRVVITGGEPTLQDLEPLIYLLKSARHWIQLETSGQNSLKRKRLPDWITLSPKAALDYNTQIDAPVHEVKWVVDEALELDTVMAAWDWWAWQPRAPYFVLMPEGCPPKDAMVKKALSLLYEAPKMAPWRIGDRLQFRIGVK